MEQQKHIRYIISVSLAAVLLVSGMFATSSCGGRSGQIREAEIDSINEKAYRARYISLDTTAHYAQMALEQATDYNEGLAEAYGNLAFVQYMLMDYDSAQVLYQHSYDLTNSMLTKAAADVGLMKICHVTGRNEAFYGYRSDAEQKIRRIDEEPMLLTHHQQILLNYAKSEFHMASSAYYNYIMQDSLSTMELKTIGGDMTMLNNDPAQLARYYTLTGELESAMEIARRANLTYMHASVLQRMAQNFINSADAQQPGAAPPFALSLAQTALAIFRQYGSLYSRAQTYLTISDYYLHANMPEVALDTATKALEFVNIQHRKVYGDDSDFLMPFDSQQDTLSTEMSWMQQGYTNCAWEWIATIREHLSMIYSSLGMKRQSDYNRNIYLDILDATRQDRQLEHQVIVLEHERQRQNILIIAVALISLALMAWLYVAIRRMKRNSERKYEKDLQMVEASFKQWMDDNDQIYMSMEEREKKLDSETYLHEQHIAENKRSYIDKCTSLSLVYSITPFLDRAINELDKLQNAEESKEVRDGRMDYLRELIDRICLYNDVLSHWIKVKQGMVSLNIENFGLQPLFDTLAKSQKTFANKGLSLKLEHTDAVVKADKALTMFMINTLLDNARKYTPRGGSVGVSAEVTPDYVEISVTDTGRGLSATDIQTICNEKVYDSNRIGEADDNEELKQQKGFGFGLMNCKGIIDKYKKTNSLFSVCMFNIESTLGKGSRFYFRLPKGVLRLSVLTVALVLSLTGRATVTADDSPEYYLTVGSQYADSVYFANIDGLYDKALAYADSALNQLNAYYIALNPEGNLLLTLQSKGQYTDIMLWNSGFETNYDVILDIRNEAAIAALALKQWDTYHYNNEIYFRLYKLVTHDNSLESISSSIRKANITRQTLIVLAILLVVAGALAFTIIYYRIHLLPTFNMRQLMQFNQRLFSSKETDLAQLAFDGVNDIKSIRALELYVKGEDGALNMIGSKYQSVHADVWPDELSALVAQTMATGEGITAADRRIRVYPLCPGNVEPAGNSIAEDGQGEVVGVLAVMMSDPTLADGDKHLIKLVTQHLATYIYYSNIRMEDQRSAIELKEDERLRAWREEQNIHVRNMVLDNNLSAIKHETMYYPSRIRQILADTSAPGSSEQITTLNELVNYYKDVFALLAQCASRQLDNIPLRCKPVDANLLAHYAQKAMKRYMRRVEADITLTVDVQTTHAIMGDRQMLEYLVDNLLSAALHTDADGQLLLSFTTDSDNMACIRLTDTRNLFTPQQLAQLFYPDNLHYDETNDRLTGIEYMVCRQIVREHDRYGGRQRCRIEADRSESGGYEISVKLMSEI